jgi:hypothetical protein
VKDSFFEELERLFDKFLEYHMKILLGDFNAKVSKEDIFKPIIQNESLDEISNDRDTDNAIYKNLIVKSTMYSHCNILSF